MPTCHRADAIRWRMRRSALLALMTTAGLAIAPPAAAQDATAPPAEQDAPFTLYLPEYEPGPNSLPAALRPLDMTRPTLPEDVEAELAPGVAVPGALRR